MRIPDYFCVGFSLYPKLWR